MAAGKQRRVPGSIDPEVSWVKHEHLVRHCPAWAEGLARIYLDKDEPFRKKHPIAFLRCPARKALPGLLRDGAVDVAGDLCHLPQASRHCWRPCTEPGCGHPLRGMRAARRRTAGSAGDHFGPHLETHSHGQHRTVSCQLPLGCQGALPMKEQGRGTQEMSPLGLLSCHTAG